MNDDGFPDVRWGHDPGPLLTKALTALLATRFGSWCIRKLTPLDHRLLARSQGRHTIFGPVGVPLLLLTTIGKKSGEPRTTPLVYMREDNRLFLVGSNFGQSTHPAWSWNLLANPHAWVTIGGEKIPVVATPVTGGERERIFSKFSDYAVNYQAYWGRTDRELRVFALSRR
jgi:deazaflavin-dependent oxidoreductase (nitroreductase family)